MDSSTSRSPVDVEKKGNTTVIIVANKMLKLVGRKFEEKAIYSPSSYTIFPFVIAE